MKKTLLWMVVASIGLFSACKSENDIENNDNGDETIPIPMHFSEKIEKDNAFTFDLFRTTYIHSKDENVFISPLSVSLAFNMVLNGAEGETQTEILKALRSNGYSVDDLNAYSLSLCSELTANDESEYIREPAIELNIANSIWCNNNWEKFPVKKDFIETNRTYYDAEVNEIDFSASDALTRINGWCAEKTNHKIENVLDKVNPDALLYIINAVYFKGDWFYPFVKDYTQSERFYQEDGNDMIVDMMKTTYYFTYSEDEYCQYLELPYRDWNFGMILMLPQEGKTTGDVIKNMDNDRWTLAEKSAKSTYANLELPRFKFECKYEMQDNILPDMGMKAPFNPDLADFSGISDISQLFISRVIHNTFIEVNEKGTEAAATTVIEFPVGDSGIAPPKPIDYIVNKPFLFAIREKTTGAILFIGKVGEINNK